MARDDHQDPVVRPVAGIRGGGAVDDDGGSVSDHERRSTPIGHEPRPTPIEHDPRTTVPPHEQRHPPIEHEHEHETVGGDRVRGHGGFPHERLDAYRVALTMASASKRVAADIPRGHRSVADHMLRAAANGVLLLAEGANRRTPKEKRQRFAESRAECAEVAAAADLVAALDLGPAHRAWELKHLAGRVAAMLTGLITRLN